MTWTVGASGVPAPSYQWRWNGTNIVGATNAMLTLNNFQPMQTGSYGVVVSNFAGTVASVDAIVTVIGEHALRFTNWGRTSAGLFRLQMLCAPGSQCIIQASTNLVNWLPIFTNMVQRESFEFVDLAATNYLWRFYRASSGP